MPGGFSGLAGYNRFFRTPQTSQYGYWDTYGAGVLPGGNLQVSPSQTGQARSMPGVDIPVVGYPGTGWNPNQRLEPQYQNSLPGVGLPNRGDIGGNGLFDPLGTGYSNVPPNENIMPGGTRFYPSDPGSPLGYPDLSNAPVVTPANATDLSNLPPVTVDPPDPRRRPGNLYGTTPTGPDWFQPMPGESWIGGGFAFTDPNTKQPVYNPLGYGRFGRGPGMNIPQSNRDVGYSPGGGGMGAFGGFANALASGSGFGGGLASLGGGGWQTVSGMPEFSGFAGAVGRAMAGPLQP